jgi:hypothetical protein
LSTAATGIDGSDGSGSVALIVVCILDGHVTQDLGGGVPDYVVRCNSAIEAAVKTARAAGKTPILIGENRGALAAHAYGVKLDIDAVGINPPCVTTGVAKTYKPNSKTRIFSIALGSYGPFDEPITPIGTTFVVGGLKSKLAKSTCVGAIGAFHAALDAQ